jgi:hypothetical protein
VKISFSDLLFQLFFRGVLIATAIHEYGHLLALRLIGVPGEIRSTVLNAVYPSELITGPDAVIFYGGGGAVQAIAFTLMALRNKDAENRLINIWIAIQGIVYGAFEALTPKNYWNLGASIGTYVALFIIIGIIIWRKPAVTP